MKKLLFNLLFSLIGVVVFAQVTTSSIKGVISDETNAGLPGANASWITLYFLT
ncbi:hypothetical protein N9R87_03880 [Flavobacteriaceae bacterium]|nr:hypothetical protein [Flavobacteriaceae bacterium]